MELIDHESLADLAKQFNLLATAADKVFAELKTKWYEVGAGSDGAQHAVSAFKEQYGLLLAEGKDKDAGDLLKGTRETAQHTLDLMHKLQEAQGSAALFAFKGPADPETFKKVGAELAAITAPLA